MEAGQGGARMDCGLVGHGLFSAGTRRWRHPGQPIHWKTRGGGATEGPSERPGVPQGVRAFSVMSCSCSLSVSFLKWTFYWFNHEVEGLTQLLLPEIQNSNFRVGVSHPKSLNSKLA